MPELSVIIPARCEEWLNLTVQDVLSHIEADTEIIVVCDGAWPNEPLEQHERIQIVYLPDAIGQRAATNLGARISTADFILKADAHVAFDQGFDRKLIEAAKELGPDVTQIPAGHNLHVFDRICDKCGKREYQGPMQAECIICGPTTWTREIVWNAKRRRAEGWRFDSELHYQSWGELKHRPEFRQGDFIETMSCLGACWFLSRERYWQLGGLDEAHGSWGQMGTELACKAWLSGGRMVTNTRTWFSHMFRTQGLDFSFPYPITGADQEKARQYSRQLWKGNKWPQQVKPLRWLVDKFWPVPGWTEEQRDALTRTNVVGTRSDEGDGRGISEGAERVERISNDRATGIYSERGRAAAHKGIVYYTDNRLDSEIADACLGTALASGLPFVAVSLKKIPGLTWEQNVVLDLERGYLTMFRQILTGLQEIDTEFVFFCEHDLLYHPSHFDFTPPNSTQVFYQQNVWKVDSETGRALHYLCSQTSGLCASRELLLEHYRKRVAIVEANGFSRKMGFEPGTHRRAERVDDLTARTWMSEYPNVDIRHDKNLTPSRWRKEQFRDQRYTKGWTEADAIPGWGVTKGRFREFLKEAVHGTVQQAVA